MRTETITLYQFNELSDEAKESAIGGFRDDAHSYGFAWDHEWRDSLNAFEKELGFTLSEWSVSPHQSWYHVSFKDVKDAMRGRKLSSVDPHYTPTGYCADAVLWGTLHQTWKRTGDPVWAVERALDEFFRAWQEDQEYQLSDEHITDMIMANEYEFHEDGTLV